MSSRLPVTLALAFTAIATVATSPVRQAADATTLIVSLLERPIGRETSLLRRDLRGWLFTSELDLLERGGALQFSATLRLGTDLSPARFTAKGRTYRFVNANADVAFGAGAAQVTQDGATTRVPLPRTYFAALSYAPLAARGLLIRYWESHGRPPSLVVVPGTPTRDIRIQSRGTQVVRVNGRDVTLRRYTVDGIVWGRETVWLDTTDRLAAIVSRIHILPIEAVREDVQDALPALLQTAASDGMAALDALSAQTPPIASGSFAIVGATLIDGTGRAPIDSAAILVRDGRIAGVGPRDAIAIPSGVRVVDARGATITPGLWDMHAHASQIEWAPAYLAAGVTTIRDMGGERLFLLALRDALARDRALGPRLLLAGLVDGDVDDAFGVTVAATPEAGRAAVDAYHADRFDQIKLYSRLQPEVVAAIVGRAHELGMTVTGHVPAALGVSRAIDAGMDHVAHMPVGGDPASPAAQAVIARIAERRVVVDPTLPWGELLGRAPETPVEQIEPGLASAPPALLMNYRSVTNATDAAGARARLVRQLAMFKALHAAGVPIVAGTDGAVPGHSLLRALELSVEAGLSPMQALQSATLVPARAMRLEHDTGTIETGKRADLLILDGNPLADISNIRRARWVVIGGRLYDPAPLWRAAGFIVPAR